MIQRKLHVQKNMNWQSHVSFNKCLSLLNKNKSVLIGYLFTASLSIKHSLSQAGNGNYSSTQVDKNLFDLGHQ